MTGFAAASTETLETVRNNLLDGLVLVAESIAAGSFLTVGDKGAAPPSQSGQTTLALLAGVDAELAGRRHGSRGGDAPLP